LGTDYTSRLGNFHLSISDVELVGDMLTKLGADMTEFSYLNDGDFIKPETCEAWAKLLRDHANEIEDEDDRKWILEFAEYLADCGGCQQW
jgi:hypothetical protein